MTLETGAGSAVLPSPAPLVVRIRETFIAPAALARTIRDRPRWLDVLLISTAVALVVAATLPAEFFLAGAEDAVTRRGAPVEITSPPEEIVRWGRRLAMLNALIGHPLIAFALAGVLTLVFSVLAGGRAGYVQHLSLASHALMILALGSLTGILARWATGDTTAEPTLGLLVPGFAEAGVVGRMLSMLNPFTIWMLIVVGIGVSVLDPARSRRSALTILLGGYLALLLAVSLAT